MAAPAAADAQQAATTEASDAAAAAGKKRARSSSPPIPIVTPVETNGGGSSGDGGGVKTAAENAAAAGATVVHQDAQDQDRCLRLDLFAQPYSFCFCFLRHSISSFTASQLKTCVFNENKRAVLLVLKHNPQQFWNIHSVKQMLGFPRML